MKKNIILFLLAVVSLLFLSGCGNNELSISISQSDKATQQETSKNTNLPVSFKETVADKVQVFLFHGTQRCSTCIAIGKLAGETVNERFQTEIKSDRIEFKEINIDLPENKGLAIKFQASGSALYLNAIRGNKDNIEQDTKVWRRII